jgi:hypothetical protein
MYAEYLIPNLSVLSRILDLENREAELWESSYNQNSEGPFSISFKISFRLNSLGNIFIDTATISLDVEAKEKNGR